METLIHIYLGVSQFIETSTQADENQSIHYYKRSQPRAMNTMIQHEPIYVPVHALSLFDSFAKHITKIKLVPARQTKRKASSEQRTVPGNRPILKRSKTTRNYFCAQNKSIDAIALRVLDRKQKLKARKRELQEKIFEDDADKHEFWDSINPFGRLEDDESDIELLSESDIEFNGVWDEFDIDFDSVSDIEFDTDLRSQLSKIYADGNSRSEEVVTFADSKSPQVPANMQGHMRVALAISSSQKNIHEHTTDQCRSAGAREAPGS